MQLVLADPQKEKREKLSQIGSVPEGQTCPGFTFPSPWIDKGAILELDGRVIGVRLQTIQGSVSDFGLINPEVAQPELVDFNDSK